MELRHGCCLAPSMSELLMTESATPGPLAVCAVTESIGLSTMRKELLLPSPCMGRAFSGGKGR